MFTRQPSILYSLSIVLRISAITMAACLVSLIALIAFESDVSIGLVSTQWYGVMLAGALLRLTLFGETYATNALATVNRENRTQAWKSKTL